MEGDLYRFEAEDDGAAIFERKMIADRVLCVRKGAQVRSTFVLLYSPLMPFGGHAS